MPTTPALNTDAFWGPIRISALSGSVGGTPAANMVTVPATLDGLFESHEPGHFMIEGAGFDVSRQDYQKTFVTAHAAKTAYPYVVGIRGTAGGLTTLIRDVRILTVPDSQTVGEWSTNRYELACGDPEHFMEAGMLFDHTIAHTGGVSAPVTGTPVQVGAVSATQSLLVYLGNPHFPTPTWSGAAMQLESDPVVGFTTATLRGTAMTGIGSTASYELQTISGPITDTWWRLNVTTVPSGVGWPVCHVWIIDN